MIISLSLLQLPVIGDVNVSFVVAGLFICGFLAETLAYVIANPHDRLSYTPVDSDDASEEFSARALTILGLVVAIVSLLYTESPSVVLALLALSASFIMLSYQIENFALTVVIAIELQARALEYGTLALFTSLVVLYAIAGLPLANLLVAALCLVIAIRIGSEVVGLWITRHIWTETKALLVETSLVPPDQTDSYSSVTYLKAVLRDHRYPSKVEQSLTDGEVSHPTQGDDSGAAVGQSA